MFGGTYPVLRIIQIYVSLKGRKSGVAKQLFDELKKYGNDAGFSYIKARVASDLEANGFYKKLGFSIVSQVKGGETTGRIINVQSYELNAPSLFDALDIKMNHNFNLSEIEISEPPLLSTPTYAFDLNIIHDTVKDRELRKISGNIFSRAQSGEYKICTTPEFIRELERTTNDETDPLLVFAKNTLPVLSELPQEKLAQMENELDKIVFRGSAKIGKKAPNKLSDLRHLAYSILHELSGFITRDNALLACRHIIKDKYRINILSPFDFDCGFDIPDSLILSNNHNQPLHFVTDSVLTAKEIKTFIDRLGIYWDVDSISININSSSQIRIIVIKGSQIVGLLVLSSRLNNGYYAELIVDENIPDASKIIDHLLVLLMDSTTNVDAGFLKITIPVNNQLSADTLHKQGFIRLRGTNPVNIQFKKIFCGYFISSASWNDAKHFIHENLECSMPEHFPNSKEWENTGIYIENNGKSAVLQLFDFENLISPTMILFQGRDGLIIPITGNYSRKLFGNTSIQGELPSIITEEEAMLSLEKAYFSVPKNTAIFKKGMPVVFYESNPRSSAIGWGKITSVNVRDVDEILLHYSRQGVLIKEDLLNLANNNNEVQVVTFDNFVEFPNKIPYKELHRMGCDNGARFVTAQKIDSEQLYNIATYAFKR